MTRRRRARKRCEYHDKPSWRDEEAAIWGARKYYRAALRTHGRYDPMWMYRCPATKILEPHHWHLTSQPHSNQKPITLEDE